MFSKICYASATEGAGASVPGFGNPIPPPHAPATPPGKAPRAPSRAAASPRRSAAKKTARKPRAAKAPRAKQARRGPAALTLNVSSAFELLAGCKKKDIAAIQGVAALLDQLNKAARARVLEAVKAIVER